MTPFPKGPFRFFALDVETANNDRASICQIGVACVRSDNSIETWMTYIDPQVDRWVFTYLHGISARTVKGAPTFSEVLPVLRDALAAHTVYQHSGFDRSAVAAACGNSSLDIPQWYWCDSVRVARTAWPELCGNGGHGLASLKQHLGLEFEHHDAGDDARAAAEVVLRAEVGLPVRTQNSDLLIRTENTDDFNSNKDNHDMTTSADAAVIPPIPSKAEPFRNAGHFIGTTEITQGNIDNDHIYLRSFFGKFPTDAVGGSNYASAAPRQISVDCGSGTAIMTDLDGSKLFFRKRGWIRAFFKRNGARAGDTVMVEQVAPYCYRVVHQRRGQLK